MLNAINKIAMNVKIKIFYIIINVLLSVLKNILILIKFVRLVHKIVYNVRMKMNVLNVFKNTPFKLTYVLMLVALHT